MCNECHFTYCPEACPGYDGNGGRPLGRCALCGSYIYADDKHTEGNGELYCADCLEELDTSTLLYICNMASIYELLHELGFECADSV
ncbi:MAG: hypothetical protein IJX46_04520 [Clostridia bacterium]|nr:hypothetical protein [Clostridia bacterium]